MIYGDRYIDIDVTDISAISPYSDYSDSFQVILKSGEKIDIGGTKKSRKNLVDFWKSMYGL